MSQSRIKKVAICNIKTGEFVLSSKRRVFYDKKPDWEQKYLF